MTYRNSEGSTGRWDKDKGFVPFASQAEADASLKPGKAAQASAPASLPDDFPERELLIGTAFKSPEALKAASDEELLAVDGIGPAKLKAIREALKGQ